MSESVNNGMPWDRAVGVLRAVEATLPRLNALLVSRYDHLTDEDARIYHVELRASTFAGSDIAKLQQIANDYDLTLTVSDAGRPAYLTETVIVRFYEYPEGGRV